MKKVITYGTYDLFHVGHLNLLKNAKALGDYLIVGITSDEYDRSRGKIDVRQPLTERIKSVEATGLADEIVVEEYEGQKIVDILKYNVDIFTVGNDWVGKFDYLNEFCKVVYLPRTQGISSTEIRQAKNDTLRLGIYGTRNPAARFAQESLAVNGIEPVAVYGNDGAETAMIADACHAENFFGRRDEFFQAIDAIYVVARLDRHYAVIKEALTLGKHVICEAPMFLNPDEAEECYALAKEKNLVLFEGIKTRYFPAFKHLVLLCKCGKIGKIKDIEVTFSQNLEGVDYGSLNKYQGSIYDLASYVFLPMQQLLGQEIRESHIYANRQNEFDLFTKGILRYDHALASFKCGLGVKTEGQMIITGTKGYIYVPAPWWLTDYFEIRTEDLRNTKKYFWQYEGDGFRHEIIAFVRQVNNGPTADTAKAESDARMTAKLLSEFTAGGYELF